MNVEITARRLTVEPKVKDTVEKRLAKLAKVLPPEAQAKVMLKAEKRGFSFEIAVTARQRTWAAEATAADQLTAAQNALDRLAGQAKKTKAMVKEVKKHTPESVRAAEATGAATPRAASRAPRSETVEARPMFDEDALHAFSHAKREILPYRDPSDDAIKVLYRRKDGSVATLTVV